MIYVTNTYVIIPTIDYYKDYVNSLLSYFSKTDPETMVKVEFVQIIEDALYVPIGYLGFLQLDLSRPDVTDLRTNRIPGLIPDNDSDELIRKSLPGIILRDDQVLAVRKALEKNSGIYQMATGSGKTEVICAIINHWCGRLNLPLNIIILEPTVNLVKQTIARLARYDIEATEYGATREVGGIQVTHPISLFNDLAINPDHLKDVNVLICDEGHHLTAVTWRTLLLSAPNLEVRLAFSASVIEQDHIQPILNPVLLDLEEFLVVGAVGPLVLNFTPAYYIKNKVLATPAVIRLYNPADEFVPPSTKKQNIKYNGVDYAAIKKIRLSSDTRMKQAVLAIQQFSDLGLKILVLVDTKLSAAKLLTNLHDLGLSKYARLLFGMQKSLRYNPSTGLTEPDDQNALTLFETGRINILIGTSVLYEGTDLPLLDVVMLYSVGVEQRVFIQTVGRVLRRGKSGNFAYIVDFTDHNCNVLSRHSKTRRYMYETIIGVQSRHIFDDVQPHQIPYIYSNMEDGVNNDCNK